jgi:hypothetical protein
MVEGEKEFPEIEMPVSEAQDMVDGEKELPEIEMPRKILPSMEIITTILQVPENDQNHHCIPRGRPCIPHGMRRCCPPHHCVRHRHGFRCM